MNWKIAFWIVAFSPYGLYLLFKSIKAKQENKLSQDLSNQSENEADIESPHESSKGRNFIGLVKFLVLFAGPIVICRSLLDQEQLEAVADIFAVYVFVGIPFILFPGSRRFIFKSAIVVGVFAVFGFIVYQAANFVGGFFEMTAMEMMDNLFFKIIFVILCLPAWFIGMAIVAGNSNDPELKKHIEENSFSKKDMGIMLTAAGIISIGALGYIIWMYKDSLLALVINAGLVIGFILIVLGINSGLG